MELIVKDDAGILRLPADLDVAGARRSDEMLDQTFRDLPEVDRILVDLSDTSFLDSVGLGLLVSIRARCQDLGIPLALQDVPSRFERVLMLSGLDTLFDRVTARQLEPLRSAFVTGLERTARFELPDRVALPPAPDARFERLAELARRAVGAPIAFVRLVDKTGQVSPGVAGMPDAPRHEGLDASFCAYVVSGGAPLVFDDTRAVPMIEGNPSVDLFGAYAGMPLTDHTGRVVGSLCVMDPEPRHWTDRELETLSDLAQAASTELQMQTAVGHAAVAADRERFAQQLNRDVFGELLSVAMLVDGARSVSSGRAADLLDEAAQKVDAAVKQLRSSLFERV